MVQIETHNRAPSVENERLRAEAGYLNIDDPAKVAALLQKNANDLSWSWKVWLPEGSWRLQSRMFGIPAAGVADAMDTRGMEGGREVHVAVTIYKKGIDAQWQFLSSLDGSQLARALPDTHQLVAPAPLVRRTIEIAGSGDRETADADQPLVLLRIRAHAIEQKTFGEQSKEGSLSSDGVMVWIVRDK